MAVTSIIAWFLISFCAIGVPMGFGFVVRPKLTIAITVATIAVCGLALLMIVEGSGSLTFEGGQTLASALGGFTGSFAGQFLGMSYERDPL